MNTEELKKILIKLKNDKKSMFIIILGLVGMFMIMLSGTDSEGVEPDKASDTQLILSEKELATEVEAFVKNIYGAGKTKVILTFESFEETVYAYDVDENIASDGKTDYTSEYVIIDSGNKEDGLKLKIISPKIRGIAIICEGGDDPIVKSQIISALAALFDITTNRISVAPMAT